MLAFEFDMLGVEEHEEGSETRGSNKDNIEENSNFYLGKDKVTMWYKTPNKQGLKVSYHYSLTWSYWSSKVRENCQMVEFHVY